ncbi:HAMP domain-containing sensor histidine kinase [Brevibacillus brevis]|uniref:histidine kinase n=1 Tax=Brevibacillus brevis TaxID=1393 RepID=A0ABY9T3J8_BREBE|nr:HAMP domain-containing sensor histidine kinase [Brevibacillus brevis]WNC14677.1 HAMP domain-containing sensor histidine kinase [Brevibacillus brevis]
MFTRWPLSRKQPVKAVPLLRYWTWRYAMILLIMLLCIALFGIYWLRKNTMEQQFEILEARTSLLADSFSKVVEAVPAASLTTIIKRGSVSQSTVIAGPASPPAAIKAPGSPTDATTAAMQVKILPAVPLNHVVQIYDEANKQVLSPDSSKVIGVKISTLPAPATPASGQKETREVLKTEDGTWLRVGVPYYQQHTLAGMYYVSTRLNTDTVDTYIMIMVSIGVIMLCGWGVVYVLSRSLTLPLRQLAVAAEQVSAGNYRPKLPDSTRIKESEISQLVHSFDDMANRLGQLERMRTDLLAGVSHELRTPVTSIRGMIQAVKDGVVTGREAEEFMQISMDEAKRLQDMVNDLLDFASMEAGAIAKNVSTVHLAPFLNQLISQWHAVPDHSDLDVTLTGLPEELVWSGDKAHLTQILLNLMNNSAAAGASRIELAVASGRQLLTIDVTDDGKGIPSGEVPFIFERYYRGDSKRKKKHGLGLGLTICRMLATANGGDVKLLETSEQGTSFRITLSHPA